MTCEWGAGFPEDIRKKMVGAGINCCGSERKMPQAAKTTRVTEQMQKRESQEDVDTSHLSNTHAIGSSQEPSMKNVLTYNNPCST